ncbi:multidrug resistance protein [Colletotrichum truncatum]|uniref:Multidrug resistance protein n=1 Tax=Colletotrichum truncatum TaxID=5467 RepID=A0ACC3Z7B7_COLTU|nr:multidrug resistance protein [Colletotrichum truncatum]KAF6785343.1 multidrug resistance protein [Colletotrichum truncatum]
MDLVRDTAFGHIVRFATRGKAFKYYEERNPDVWRRYVNEDKTVNAARHGQVEPPEKDENEGDRRNDDNPENRGNNSQDTSRTRVPEQNREYNDLTSTTVDPEKGKNVHLVDFLPNDPENPQNWSLFKKVFITSQICLLTIGVYIGSAIYTAGLMDVMQVFGVSQVAAVLGLTLFVAGYGLGPMLWSPLSEVPQIGRNPIYIGTLFLFVVLQVPTALSVNFGMLLAFRFITGFVGSPVLATGGATLADIWSPKKRAYALGVWGIAAVCGPTMGPLVGGFAVMSKGWTWTIWELMWLSGFALVLLFFFLPETSASNILYRRTRRLRKITGNEKLMCEPELKAQSMSSKDLVTMSLVRPFTLNFTEPMVFLLNLYIALIYGLLYIWFESFPIVFGEIYGFNLGLEGLAFLGILIGALIVIPPFFWYLHRYLEPQFDENGDLQPEKRLPPAFVGAFAVPICLFWFGWSSRPSIHWIMPIVGSGWFSIGSFLLFNSVLNYLPDAYPEYAASVLAGNDLFRSSFGAGFPLFATAMYNNLGVGWASSLLGFLAIVFIPIPFVLYKIGPKLRKNHSKHARKDL